MLIIQTTYKSLSSCHYLPGTAVYSSLTRRFRLLVPTPCSSYCVTFGWMYRPLAFSSCISSSCGKKSQQKALPSECTDIRVCPQSLSKAHVLVGSFTPLSTTLKCWSNIQVVLQPPVLVKWSRGVQFWPSDGYVENWTPYQKIHMRCLQKFVIKFKFVQPPSGPSQRHPCEHKNHQIYTTSEYRALSEGSDFKHSSCHIH